LYDPDDEDEEELLRFPLLGVGAEGAEELREFRERLDESGTVVPGKSILKEFERDGSDVRSICMYISGS
jgi:hypothetical protein